MKYIKTFETYSTNYLDENEFGKFIDKLEEDSIEQNYFGNFDEETEDVESFAENIAEFANEEIQKTNPNLIVKHIIYDTGRRYSLYDTNEESILFEYKP